MDSSERTGALTEKEYKLRSYTLSLNYKLPENFEYISKIISLFLYSRGKYY